MKQNVRFIDQIKVGSYAIIPGEDNSVIIENNIDNYVLTATGNAGAIRGESNLYFDGWYLGLGTQNPIARFELKGENNLVDLLLIRNSSNQGVKINYEGVTELIEYITTPSAKIGGIIYSGSNFWVGL
jgi:hypothetical protein